MRHPIALDLAGCCLTLNYWSQTLIPFWRKNITAYLFEQSQSPALKGPLQQFARALMIEEADLGTWCSHIVQMLEAELWPAGLPRLISELTNIAIDTGLLYPQVHADTISSFTRWHDLGWQITVLSPLLPATQQRLIEHAQAPGLRNTINRFVAMGDEHQGCNVQTLQQQLDHLKHEGRQRWSWVTSAVERLEAGRLSSYRCFYLDREFTQSQSPDMNTCHVILDLSLIDLILPDT